MKNVLWILVALGIAGLLGWTLYYLYDKAQVVVIERQTTTAEVRDIVKKTVANGSVVPRKEIEIKPQVSGIVEQLYAEPGDMVKKGDLIARVKIIPDMVNLNNAENRLSRAEIALNNAQVDFDRNEKLFKGEVISKADFQPFELALKNAKVELEASTENLQLVRDGVTKKMGNASNTMIRSTISGMVLDVPVKEGNSVIESNTFNEGTTIAMVADMGEMIFEGKIDESEVGKLSLGMDLILTVGAIEDQRFNAELEYISPKGVEENGAIQFEIKAAVELVDSVMIRAGYSANADIVLAKVDEVLAVNENTLVFEGEDVAVEVKTASGEVEKRPIETGLSDGIFIEVVSGISASDTLFIQK